jgi:hypothetical protein
MIPSLYQRLYSPDGFLLHIAVISHILSSSLPSSSNKKATNDNEISLLTYCLAVSSDERDGIKNSSQKLTSSSSSPPSISTPSPLKRVQIGRAHV